MNMKHTPGPWAVAASSNPDNGTGWRDIVSTGTVFSPSYVGEALDVDAAFIVRACNAHDELVAALEWALTSLETVNAAAGFPKNSDGPGIDWDHGFHAYAALAKAKGEA